MGLHEFSYVISSQLHEEAILTQFIFTNHSGNTRKISKLPRAGFRIFELRIPELVFH